MNAREFYLNVILFHGTFSIINVGLFIKSILFPKFMQKFIMYADR
jgi:hypothetical protein